ncbi:type IV pilus twitching motility protein PilT [Candidatus Daviesbacteria bacterium]|nr:type IV pilus twitching motility protein PilT [Candidatus Daviesbacteria bacterium]
MNIQQLLDVTVSNKASDLHLVVDFPPLLRINGELSPVPGTFVLSGEILEGMLINLLSLNQKNVFQEKWELDFGFEFEKKARFRVNIYRQRGTIGASFRLIPKEIRTIEETGLPPIVAKLTELKQGLVLVTGPTGHGKSTTLAALTNQINLTRAVHILTVEDPIEFIYPKGKALISQREMNTDTLSFANALRGALREDPDVVLIGEMRDYETIAAAITIAETGHLVFATLHTNSAAQTLDRIIDVFPENQQPQIRTQLAATLEAIISQRLVPTINPGRILAYELVFGVPALRSLIREGKTHLIDNLIQTSGEAGMATLDTILASLVRQGLITSQTALNYSIRPQLLSKLLGNK